MYKRVVETYMEPVSFKLLQTNNKYITNTEWEYPEQKILLKYVKDGDRVLQLGGNIGASCIAVSLNKNLDQNICVEPNNEIIDILKHNIKYNNMDDKITVINGIITSSNVDIYLEKSGDNANASTTFKNNTEGQIVQKVSLDNINNKYGYMNVLFADCEGCLPSFLEEYPSHNWDVIIYEKDYDGYVDYSTVDKILTDKNMISVEKGFLNVWIKKVN